MYFKTDILRENLLIYCGLATSGGLGLLCLYISIVHVPLIPVRYKYGSFLQLDIYINLIFCMLIVSLTTLIATIISACLFGSFISIKVRKKSYLYLRPVGLINSVLLFTNIWSLLNIVDPMTTIRTEIQHKFLAKMTKYQSTKKLKSENIKLQIDNIQSKIKCCGINGPTDWFNIKWLKFNQLKQLKKYQNQFGLVELAPFSCCNRSKALICPLKDSNPLLHYYDDGCSKKLTTYMIKSILSSEILLIIFVILLEILLWFLIVLTDSSIRTMKSNKYGIGIGRAYLFDNIPTRHLELQSRGIPLLIPPSEESLINQTKNFRKIEKRMKIGGIINNIPYMRYIRPSYSSTLFQYYLKLYLPILESAIFDEDPSFTVVLVRFFMKGLTGFGIGSLFLLAFSSKIDKQDNVSTTLSDLIKYTVYVSFTFAYIKSKKFRTIGILLLPNLGMKTGRTFFLAEMAQISAIGPMATIAINLQMVMMSIHCTMGIASNISHDAQQLALNPMRNLIMEAIDSSERLKKATLDVYNATQPINNDINSAKNQSEDIRKTMSDNEKTNRENQLKHRFTNMLTKLDRQEHVKFQRKSANLRNQYKQLEAQFRKSMVQLKNYKDVFSNRSSELASQMRTKMFSGCASIEKMKSQMCQKVVAGACSIIEKIGSSGLNFGLDIKQMCYEEIDSDSSCNIKRAMKRAKRCANEREAANAKDGFGAMHRGTEDGIQAMQKLHGFEVRWNFSRSKFNIDQDDLMHGTASLTFTITDGIILFLDIIIILFVLLKILVMLVILKAYSYCKKYLSDIDSDNKYATNYFECIDEQRKQEQRSSLLPLKSFEKKKVLYKQKMYTGEERKKIIKDFIKITSVIFSLGIVFFISDMFYEALSVVREVSLIQLHVRGDDSINITTTGNGIVKYLLDIMLAEIGQLSKFNATYSLSDCAPEISMVSSYYRHMFVTLLILVIILNLFSGYFVRVRHTICAYFYPKREKQRIVHLYNTMLLGRKRYMETRKNMVIFRVKCNRLEMEHGFLLNLRHDYPLCFNWLKKFAKQRCLICQDKEKKDFFVCEEDYSGFCRSCYEEMDNKCLVCVVRQMDIHSKFMNKPESALVSDDDNSNVNQYYDNQLPSEATNSSGSEDDKSTDDYQNDIDDSREIVGWDINPNWVLNNDVKFIKKIINKQKKINKVQNK